LTTENEDLITGEVEDSTPAVAPETSDTDLLDIKPKDDAVSTTDGDVLAGADKADDEGVPEYTFALAEGVEEGTIDMEKIEAFKERAAEYGLSQDQFQSLVQYDLERSQAANTQAVDEWNGRVSEWREAARADTEVGGEKFQGALKQATALVSEYGDKDMINLLKSPSEDNPDGLAIGNHPAFLRMMNRISKVMMDPVPVDGDAVPDDARASLQRIYPTMFKDSA